MFSSDLLQKILDDPEPEAYQPILERWHFSVSEQHRLLQLLKHYQMLNGSGLVFDFASGKDLLRWLENTNQRLSLSVVL